MFEDHNYDYTLPCLFEQRAAQGNPIKRATAYQYGCRCPYCTTVESHRSQALIACDCHTCLAAEIAYQTHQD